MYIPATTLYMRSVELMDTLSFLSIRRLLFTLGSLTQRNHDARLIQGWYLCSGKWYLDYQLFAHFQQSMAAAKHVVCTFTHWIAEVAIFLEYSRVYFINLL